MRIWKFPLQLTDRQTVLAPACASPLTAQLQDGALQLWALVDEEAAVSAAFTVAIYGTGNPIPDEPGRYLSTFQLDGGALVFHVFVLP